MRNLIAILLLACFPPLLRAQFAERWNAAADRPAPRDIPAMRGETFAVEPLITSAGIPADLSGMTATFFWQTNGMDAAWWSSPATVSAAETGRVSAVWSRTNDVGATAYTWFIGLDRGGTATAYRAFGRIAMRPSPGFNPSVLPPPSAYPTLAAELAPLVAPLITVTETDPAALAVLATQRVERVWSPDATEFRDGTGGVWRVVSVSQGYWSLSVLGSEYGTATNAYYEIRTAPFDFWDFANGYGTGDGQAYFAWHANDEQPGQGQIYVEVQGEEGAHDGFLETNQVASGSIDFATSIYHTMIRLAWSNEAPSIITQHIDTVELASTQAGPRLDIIEAETNKWRTAYGWGNHAQAGYATGTVLTQATSHVMAQFFDDSGFITQQILRVGIEIVTNRWGPRITLPDGIVTNGMGGPLSFGKMYIGANGNIGFGAVNSEPDGWPLTVTGSSRFNGWVYVGSMIMSDAFVYNAGGYSFRAFKGGDVVDAVAWGGNCNVSIPNGDLTVAGTNTAAEVRTLGGITMPNMGTNTTAYLFVSNNLMWVRGMTP